jgi:hypothetical protein
MKLFKKFGFSMIIMTTLFFSFMSHAVEKELSWNELIETVEPEIEVFHQRDVDPGMVFHNKKQRLYEPMNYNGLLIEARLI